MHPRCIISPCGKYRYTLWRGVLPQFESLQTFPAGIRYAVIIGLNPSTADGAVDDRTIGRCRGFAARLDVDAFCMVNLFAARATKPADMKKFTDPIGRDNDAHLKVLCPGASFIIAAWGNHGGYLKRDRGVQDLLKSMRCEVHALKMNASGRPAHPLYLPKDSALMRF